MKKLVLILLSFMVFLLVTESNNEAFALGKPSGFTSSSKGYSITLNWKKVKGSSGYEIYYSKSKNGKFKYLKKLINHRFTHENLDMNKSYYYKVRSYIKGKKTKYSAFSKTISAKTKVVEKPKVYLKLSVTYGIPAKTVWISIANGSESNITILTKGKLQDYFDKDLNRNLTLVNKIKKDYYYADPFTLKPNEYIFPVYYVVNKKTTLYDAESSSIRIYYKYQGKTFSKVSNYYENEKFNKFVYGE